MCMNGFGSRPVFVVELALLPLVIRVVQEPITPASLFSQLLSSLADSSFTLSYESPACSCIMVRGLLSPTLLDWPFWLSLAALSSLREGCL